MKAAPAKKAGGRTETGVEGMSADTEERKDARKDGGGKKKKKEKSILQKANRKGRHVNGMMMFLRILCIPIMWLIFPYRFYGPRKVKDGAIVYVGNHYTMWDIVLPPCTTTEGIHFLAKRSLAKSVIGPFCRAVNVIFLDRDGGDMHGVMDALRCLKNGEKIAMYPEGTRNKTKDQEMLPFHSGAAMMAIKTKTPIVPIVVYKKPRHFRMNHVLIGEPFEMTEYYGKKLTQELLEEADNSLRDRMIGMKHEHAAYLESRKRGKKKERQG